MWLLVRRATSDVRRAGDNRRFDIRCGCWCDERQATCDAQATIDASTRDKKNSRSTKATFCQNMDSTTALCGKEREKKTEKRRHNESFQLAQTVYTMNTQTKF
jgi:hypothetical protein